jgi:FkbM family methyltransferase
VDRFGCRIGERLRYLCGQPAFRAHPWRVAGRCLFWEYLRWRRLDVTIRVHGDCFMRLTPPARGHGHDGVVYCFRESYEPGVGFALREGLDAGAIACDVGANIGTWTLLMSRLVGSDGRVVAFEPVPRTAARLRENLLLSHAVSCTVEELALGDTSGSADVFVPYAADRASLARESAEDYVISVQVTTLDGYWTRAGSPQISFIKIDAEGSEPRILRGAERVLRACRPTVACEVNTAKLLPMGHHPDDIYGFFERHHYGPFVWVDSLLSFSPARGRPDGDVLFKPIDMGASGAR